MMACFLVPTAEAIVVSIIERRVAKNTDGNNVAAEQHEESITESDKFSWKTKLSWLAGLLWGGAILLALEHIWHGEVVFYPPFLTAMSDPADSVVMLKEMGTVGIGMAVLVTVVWVAMILIADNSATIKRALAKKTAEQGA
jgi:hypothetical protein